MFEEIQKPADNRLLYQFLQLAYNHIKSVAPDSVQGSRDDFLAHLYLGSLRQVFGIDPREDTSIDDSHFKDWFRNQRAQRASDIITGRLDDFSMGGDGSQISDDQIKGWYQDYRHNLGAKNTFGTDSYATYLPLHFFCEGEQIDDQWGIYISERGVLQLASALQQRFCNLPIYHRFRDKPPKTDLYISLAYQILLRHELEHFKIESFALNAELYLGERIYAAYLEQVYAPNYPNVKCLEEAMANSSVLNSRRVRSILQKMFADDWKLFHKEMKNVLLEDQPKCYQNVNLDQGWPVDSSYFLNKFAGYKTKPSFRGRDQREFKFNANRRLAMNYLCNQIISGRIHPEDQEIPFFAFTPDNYFLRAENLVPIHIVTTLSEEHSFVRLATPKKVKWEQFLRKLHYFKSSRGRGSHIVWEHEKRRLPDLTVDYHKNELVDNSFKSALKDLGITVNDYNVFKTTGRLPDILLSV